jgi:hypothetical protein
MQKLSAMQCTRVSQAGERGCTKQGKRKSCGLGTIKIAKGRGERGGYTIKATFATFATFPHYSQSGYKETYHWDAYHEDQHWTRLPCNQRACMLHILELFCRQPGELRKRQRTKRNERKYRTRLIRKAILEGYEAFYKMEGGWQTRGRGQA